MNQLEILVNLRFTIYNIILYHLNCYKKKLISTLLGFNHLQKKCLNLHKVYYKFLPKYVGTENCMPVIGPTFKNILQKYSKLFI